VAGERPGEAQRLAAVAKGEEIGADLIAQRLGGEGGGCQQEGDEQTTAHDDDSGGKGARK